MISWCLLLSALAQEPTAEPPGAAEPAAPQSGEASEPLPLISGPQIIDYVEAPYPADAQAAGLEAVVKLLISLDAEGEIDNIEVIEPVGHGFDEAAVDAVLAMRFAPAQTTEGPVPVVFEFEYGFVLTPEAPPDDAPAAINLDGQVREMGTRQPIAGVKVVVEGTELVGETNAEGHFSIRGVPPGAHTLRLLHSGHVTSTTKLEVSEGELTSASMWMRSESYRDNEIVGVYQRDREEVTRRTLSIEEVRKIPGTFGDPVKVIQTLPGAARSPFGSGLLVIRGSNPEDSGVYIDGVRIPIIYHLTGTTSVLSPDIIESVDYLPGGYGVQYGRSMGGVVDIKTRTDFDEQGKLIWGTDILDSQIYYEGKVKGHGLAIGARRSYIDAFIPLFLPDGGYTIKPRYWDYQVKWAPPVPGDQSLSIFLYGFDDLLAIGTPKDVAQGSDADTQGDLRTQYNSQRFLISWERRFSDRLSLRLLPSVGYDGAYFGLGDAFVLQNRNVLTELRSELEWSPSEHISVVPGVDYIGGWWSFDFKSAIKFADLDDPLAEREGAAFDGRGNAQGPDLYLKAQLRPLNDPDRWLITPGIRSSQVTTTSKGGVTDNTDLPPFTVFSVDPRISSRFALADSFTVKAATGIYHQPPQPQEMIGVGTQATVGAERSWSTSIGVEHQLSPSVEYEIEGFYKDLDNLIVFNEAWTGFGANPFLNAGIGRAYGVEFIARHQPTGRFFGWVSYTLSRSIRNDNQSATNARHPSPDDQWYLFEFDQTHILSAQGGYELPRDFSVSAQVQYVTGNPTTPYDAGIFDVDGNFYNGFQTGGYDSKRLPAFLQTSFRFDKLWTFKRWQLQTYLDLINVVRGVNPEFQIYNYDYSEYAYVRGLPFIPNLGLEAKFWL